METDLYSQSNKNTSNDPNVNYEIVKNCLSNAVNEYLPTTLVKFKKHKHSLNPWMTQGIVRSIKVRDNMYHKLKSLDPHTDSYNATKINLTTFNRILKRTIRHAKFTYYNDLLIKYRTDSKKTWDVINSLTNITKNKNSLKSFFIINGSKVTNSEIIANNFNEFFSTIGKKQAGKIPSVSNLSYKDFLVNECPSNFSFTTVTTNEIMSVIKKLKSKSSTGNDQLSTKLLKHVSEYLAPSITLILNQSLITGIFPDSLKIARVLPLFKKGDRYMFDNYRPISLLPSISKIFEKVVHSQLYQYFQSKNLLYKHQYGFRPEHSVELATLEFVDRILKCLDENFTPFSIFIDLSKAFDTLNHDILLHKLSYYGIKNTSLLWFEKYLET